MQHQAAAPRGLWRVKYSAACARQVRLLSLDVPAMSVISEADVECPMRCIGVPLNFEMLAAHYAKLRSNGDVRHASEEDGFISLFNADRVLQQWLLRRLALAGQKLGPSARAQSQLILQEIMPALLQSEGGPHLISMLQHNSADQCIHLAANVTGEY